MKSPMVTNANYVSNKSGYTDLQVLCSGAGYYIGTMYVERNAEGKVTLLEPGSRDSDYYSTEQEAQTALKLLESLGDDVAATILRDHP